MIFSNWQVIGLIAAALTTFGFIPQIITMLKHKRALDVSPITLFQFLIGTFLWALYGFHLNDPIIYIANLITLVTVVIAIILYFRFR